MSKLGKHSKRDVAKECRIAKGVGFYEIESSTQSSIQSANIFGTAILLTASYDIFEAKEFIKWSCLGTQLTLIPHDMYGMQL